MQLKSVNAILENKLAAKKRLGEKLGKDFEKTLLVAVILDKNTDQETTSRIVDLAEGAQNVDVSMVILVDEELKTECESCFLAYDKKNRLMLLEAADVALAFPFTDIEELVLNGVVPIGYEGLGIEDYNPNRETGTGFSYNDKNVWAMFAALVRAKETFKFPYDWKHLLKNSLLKLDKNTLV